MTLIRSLPVIDGYKVFYLIVGKFYEYTGLLTGTVYTYVTISGDI